MPGGVSSEGCLVLTGCTLAVDLVLHHGYAVEFGAAPEKEGGWTKKQIRRLKICQDEKTTTILDYYRQQYT